MSEKLSFRAALGRQGATRVESQNQSGSRARVRLRQGGEIARPVDVVRLLTRHGTSLRRAHAALEQLAQGSTVALEVNELDLHGLIANLCALGVDAVAVAVPDINVHDVRVRLGLSQSAFALRFGLETDTVQNWEQGRNSLDAPARMLLAIIDRSPDIVDAVLTASGSQLGLSSESSSHTQPRSRELARE